MRVFLAAEIPVDLRKPIEKETQGLVDRLPRAKWVQSSRWHLTLVFFGAVERRVVEATRALLREFARSLSSFSIQLKGAGVFSSRGRPRVAWLGVDSEGLVEVRKKIVRHLSQHDVFHADSKPFRAHLTLARPRDRWSSESVSLFRKSLDRPWGKWNCRTLELLHSELTPKGPIYHSIERFDLE